MIAECERRIKVATSDDSDRFCPCCGEHDCHELVASRDELDPLFGCEDEICKSCFCESLLRASQIGYCCDSMFSAVNLIYSAMDLGYVDREFAARCMFVAAVGYSVSK